MWLWTARQRAAFLHGAATVRTDIECVTGQPAGPITVALRRWQIRRGSREQSTAQCQLRRAMAVGEEADVTDAVEPVWNGVQQEPPNEFIRGERYHLGLAVMAIVFPGESTWPSPSRMRREFASATRWV